MNHPECKFHPDLPKYKHLTQGTNLEICEQVCQSSFEYIIVGSKSFRKLNKWKFTTRFLTVNKRLVFLKVLDDERNKR